MLRDDPAVVAGAALMELDFSHKLPKVEVPTLALWGDDDDIAPVRIGRVLAAQMPNVRLEVFANAGHAPQLDQPAAVGHRIGEVLLSWPPSRPVRPPSWIASRRNSECRGTDEISLVGAYNHIRIDSCERVTLTDVTARRITIEDSRVSMTNVTVVGDDVALRVKDSAVTVTNGRFEAATALSLHDSRVDLASVELSGRRHAIEASEASTAVFSLCTINSPLGSGGLHGIHQILPEAPL